MDQCPPVCKISVVIFSYTSTLGPERKFGLEFFQLLRSTPINHIISLPTRSYASNYAADDHADSNAQTTRSNGGDRAELPLNDGHLTRNTEGAKGANEVVHKFRIHHSRSPRPFVSERHHPTATFADESYDLPKYTRD